MADLPDPTPITPAEYVTAMEADGYRLLASQEIDDSGRWAYWELWPTGDRKKNRRPGYFERFKALRERAAASGPDFNDRIRDYLVATGRVDFPPVSA